MDDRQEDSSTPVLQIRYRDWSSSGALPGPRGASTRNAFVDDLWAVRHSDGEARSGHAPGVSVRRIEASRPWDRLHGQAPTASAESGPALLSVCNPERDVAREASRRVAEVIRSLAVAEGDDGNDAVLTKPN